MSISAFLQQHFRHFNARETRQAAAAYRRHIESGGKMLVTLGGAMSTAELGVSLAEMIRADKVHAISSTAANFEEDVFNLVAQRRYRQTSNYRDLTPEDEIALRDEGFNRVTDTCIPESAFREIEKALTAYWRAAAAAGESYYPDEFMYRLWDEGQLAPPYDVPAEHSWVLAAYEKRIPVFLPGFEDSTIGNVFAARVIDGTVSSHAAVRSGTEQMERLVHWYCETTAASTIGFFQIGGGIAGDFAICAVPLILQDLRRDVPLWSYFAQISDSTTSYGSYSGAVPNEKITWHKLAADCPRFMINSDATIVAPLIFAYVLDW